MRSAYVIRTSRIGLVEAWGIQRALADARRAGELLDVIWLLEHDPVYTTGRHGPRGDLWLSDAELAARGASFVQLDRGGQMTWHGPGQTTAYVIAGLRELTGGSVRSFVAALVEATAHAAEGMGVSGIRADHADHGAYVQTRKLGSVGVRVSGGVSLHGLALNRDPDLDWYAQMTACGAPGVPATSLAAEGASPDRTTTESRLLDALADQLQLVPEPAELDDLLETTSAGKQRLPRGDDLAQQIAVLGVGTGRGDPPA